MANPFLVLGGIAVGIVTAGFGILQVPGWVASAHDAAAVNDLANINAAQAVHLATAGTFSANITTLSSGGDITASLGSGGGGLAGIVPAAAGKKGSGTAFELSSGVTLEHLGINGEGDAFCAVVESASGNYFAASEGKPVSGKGEDVIAAMNNAGCQPETRGELADLANLTYTYSADTAACLTPGFTFAGRPGEALSATIAWGDGSTSEAVEGENTHTYAAPGDYEIVVTGSVPHVGAMTGTSASCLTGVTEWDEGVGTTSTLGMLSGTSDKLTTVADLPSTVTTLEKMFARSNANPDITKWNTANVTNMSDMFVEASRFNQPIGNWDMSSVTTITSMFAYATSFNQDLNWDDTSKVKRMNYTFTEAAAFNGDISGWNTSNVDMMNSMFLGAESFSGDISRWDVSNVWDMHGMFNGASSFSGDLSGWNASKVYHHGNSLFNQGSGITPDKMPTFKE